MRIILAAGSIMGLLFAVAADAGAAGARVSGFLGVGYRNPAPGSIADRYAGGAAFQAGVETRLGPTLVALEAGYRRSSAALDSPFFLDAARGTLTAAPIDLVARLPLARPGGWTPYAGTGFEMLWLREGFRYRLDGAPRKNEPAGGIYPGALLVAGVDRARFPRVRLEAFLSYVPIHRLRSGLGSTYEDRGAARANAGAYGVRLSWRLP